MNPIQAFETSIAEAQRVIDAVDTGQWNSPSPCAEWAASGVVHHLLSGLAMVTAGVTGTEYAPVTPPADDAELPAAFRSAAEAAVGAFQADPGVLERPVTMPFGAMPGAMIAGIFTNDVLIHAWDIAKASGQSTDLNPELAEACLARARQFINDQMRNPHMFGPEAPAPEGASTIDQLAAFTGRTV